MFVWLPILPENHITGQNEQVYNNKNVDEPCDQVD